MIAKLISVKTKTLDDRTAIIAAFEINHSITEFELNKASRHAIYSEHGKNILNWPKTDYAIKIINGEQTATPITMDMKTDPA